MPTTRTLCPLRAALVLAAAALLLAAPRRAPAAEADDDGRERVKTTSGKIVRIDRTRPELVVETAEGPLALSYDRNTTVFLDRRLGTLRDLDAGTAVRAGYDVARKRAHWIEVRRPGATENPAVREAATPTPPSLPPPPGTEAQAAAPDETPREAPTDARPPDTSQPTQPPQPPEDPTPPRGPGPGGPIPDPVLPPGMPGSGAIGR